MRHLYRLLFLLALMAIIVFSPFKRILLGIRDGIALTWMDWTESCQSFVDAWRNA